MDFSVSMAIVDYIPVILFALGAIILGSQIGDSMKKGNFALFSAGAINVFAAGFLKATWKLLYALGICDFEKLNAIFFPLQAIGFVLLAVGLCLFVFGSGKSTMLSVVPAVYSGTMLFVVLMILGVFGMNAALCTLAVRQKKPLALILSIISFIFVLGMGYLSSKDFTQSYMNWAAEIVNTVGQGSFLFSVITLKHSGLKESLK